jgi:preprotein translocase subunit SecA
MRQVMAEQQQRLQVAQHAGETEEQAKVAKTVRKTGGKIGRNDMCPCGSGKKFKFCHEGREGELFALLQGRAPASAPQPASVSAQLATGQAGVVKPAAEAARGRSVPPASATPPQAKGNGNGKSGKAPQQAQRGKGASSKKK